MKNTFKEAIKSRVIISLWVLLLIQTVFLIIFTLANIHVSQLQIPVRFSAFSSTQYFRDQWFYIINFAVISLVYLVLNIAISVKLLNVKGRHLAIAFLWLSVAVLAISTLLILAVLRVAGIQ